MMFAAHCHIAHHRHTARCNAHNSQQLNVLPLAALRACLLAYSCPPATLGTGLHLTICSLAAPTESLEASSCALVASRGSQQLSLLPPCSPQHVSAAEYLAL